MNSHTEAVQSALNFVQSQWNESPRCGIVLGSGLGAVGDEIDADTVIPYEQIPNFVRSTVAGHSGELICGELSGVPVVAMRGRFHRYEGYSWEQITFPTKLLCALGIDVMIVSNAAGGLNPRFSAGDVMMIDSHIDMLFATRPMLDHLKPGGRANKRLVEPYDPQLIEVAERVARKCEFVLRRGVYIPVSGPTYETRAEYRMLRTIGGDAAGMSTVPEVCTAAQLGVRVVGISTITNVADPDFPQETSHADVVAVAKTAEQKLRRIVVGLMNAV